jgi:hypothetical protein
MPIVGWLVNWSTYGFSIKRDELVDVLDKSGIDPSVARAVLPKNAAVRAVRDNAKGKDRFHRKFADGQDAAAFGIVETDNVVSQAADFKVDMNVGTRVLFDKNNHSIQVTGSKKGEVEESFKEKLVTYASDQFRSIVLRYIKRQCSGVTYLETGNLYFVSVAKKDELDKLIKLFNTLGPTVKLFIKEEISTKQVRNVMWSLATKEIASEIDKLQEDLEESTSEQGLKSRLVKYQNVKTKVEMFETALQATGETLKQKLDALTANVKKKLEIE